VDVGDLTVFLSLCETENTRDTAAELGTGQPNVSRALARLERDLCVRLFARHGRRLTLNRFGQMFRGHAERSVAELGTGRRRIAADTNPDTGIVRLGFLQSTARDVVPGLLRRYRAGVPGSRFELRQGLARDLYEALAHDHLDVLVVTAPRTAPADLDDDGVHFHPMLRQQLCLAVPATHRVAGRSSVSLQAVVDEPFIAFSQGADLRRTTDRLLSDAAVEPEVAFESMEIDTVVGLISAGLGIGVLPYPTNLLPNGPTYVPIDPPTIRVIGLAWSTSTRATASVAQFVDHTTAQTSSRAGRAPDVTHPGRVVLEQLAGEGAQLGVGAAGSGHFDELTAGPPGAVSVAEPEVVLVGEQECHSAPQSPTVR